MAALTCFLVNTRCPFYHVPYHGSFIASPGISDESFHPQGHPKGTVSSTNNLAAVARTSQQTTSTRHDQATGAHNLCSLTLHAVREPLNNQTNIAVFTTSRDLLFN
jgi:hypothetical protein